MTRPVSSIEAITHRSDARDVALASYDALINLLEVLEPTDWEAPTECPGWSVADMVGHLIGAAEADASMREMVRQLVWGWRHRPEFDGNALDAVNALQVDEHRHLTPAARIDTLRAVAPRAVAGRLRTPRLMRRFAVPVEQGGSTVGFPASLPIGHLMDIIHTRDSWLHRIDIARATGRESTSVVDERIVEDVVAEWAARHGESFQLTLTGHAGGEFQHGTGGQTITLDAIEFCRTLSGRAHGDGLLAWKVLF